MGLHSSAEPPQPSGAWGRGVCAIPGTKVLLIHWTWRFVLWLAGYKELAEEKPV